MQKIHFTHDDLQPEKFQFHGICIIYVSHGLFCHINHPKIEKYTI